LREFSKGICGDHFNNLTAFSVSEKIVSTSPFLLSPNLKLTLILFIFSNVFITSRTEKPFPEPKLKVS